MERERHEHNELAWAVWHGEALARSKKLPKLETLLHQAPKQRSAAMTADQIEAVTRSWLASRHRTNRNGR